MTEALTATATPPRIAVRTRRTAETSIDCRLGLDGGGASLGGGTSLGGAASLTQGASLGGAASLTQGGPLVETGLPFFDHMVSQLGRHGGIELTLTAKGDLQVDAHHTVEDVGIVLGEALAEALGDKAGIRRFASVSLPLDEALVEVALDLSGRAYLFYDVAFPADAVPLGAPAFEPQLAEEFWRAFVTAAGITLHLHLVRGRNTHHILEASFKAVARALRDAVRVEGVQIPSTKGFLA